MITVVKPLLFNVRLNKSLSSSLFHVVCDLSHLTLKKKDFLELLNLIMNIGPTLFN